MGNVVIVSGCTLRLENGIQADNVIFLNCLIKYRGGPIPIRHAEFKNCLFDIEIEGVPSQQGKSMLVQMTSSTGEDLKISIPG